MVLEYSFVKSNMKNIHLNVLFHEGGFFSNFNKVTTFLKNTSDNVVKITWNLQGQPYGAFAYSCGEVFGKLFEDYNSNVVPDETIVLQTYTDTSYTGREVHEKYTQKDWRHKFNNTLKYFKPAPSLQEHINKIKYKYIFSSEKVNLIGVLKRNERLKCEQHNNTLPTLEDYFREIDKIKTDNTYLYLSVDNNYDVEQFIKRYKKCIYNPKVRRTNVSTDEEPHFTPGSAEDALHNYLEVYTLSLCKSFIHPLSNMSTAALYFNPELTSIYI